MLSDIENVGISDFISADECKSSDDDIVQPCSPVKHQLRIKATTDDNSTIDNTCFICNKSKLETEDYHMVSTMNIDSNVRTMAIELHNTVS